MARAATTTDAFNAVAEPRRREILDLLAERDRAVGDLVTELGLPQPAVSKHLRVLREVGLVTSRSDGRHRVYTLDGRPLEQIHRWLRRYQEWWDERFSAMDDVLAELVEQRRAGLEVTPGSDDEERA